MLQKFQIQALLRKSGLNEQFSWRTVLTLDLSLYFQVRSWETRNFIIVQVCRAPQTVFSACVDIGTRGARTLFETEDAHAEQALHLRYLPWGFRFISVCGGPKTGQTCNCQSALGRKLKYKL